MTDLGVFEAKDKFWEDFDLNFIRSFGLDIVSVDRLFVLMKNIVSQMEFWVSPLPWLQLALIFCNFGESDKDLSSVPDDQS